MPKVHIEGHSTVEVESGTRLVKAIQAADVDIGHRCGGHARCTTCRVQFLDGEPDTATRAEYERLSEDDLWGEVRLSCQIVVDHDMHVKPLMRVSTEGWDDAGPEPEDVVTPIDEWYPIDELSS